MKPDRWAQIDRLLDEALEHETDERAAFLAVACVDDPELRQEVESLLVAHDRAQGFLKKPALEIAAKDLAHQQHHSLIGKPLGPYQVRSVLGKGGMGEVYLAQDTRLARKVALKLLPREFTQNKERVQRFEREARAASGLNHPNILTIYEIGELDETHFIASEYIEGRTLREALAHGALPEKEVLDIGIQIAEALAAAHEAGIIHRDIKPENVMLRHDGYVKVLDFGLAKLTEAPSSQFITQGSEQGNMKTNPGAILGTARYMSPEQALGEEVDRRTDLFSLGVLLYELAVGAPPFKGVTTPATLDAIVHHTPVPLAQLKPTLHQELGLIVDRALEKKRDLRYQSATDLRADLKRLQRDLQAAPMSSTSGRVAVPNLPPPVPNTHGRIIKIAAALLCVALLAAGIWWWGTFRFSKPFSTDWRDAFVRLQTDYPGEEVFPSLAPDGLNIVYARWNKDNLDIYSQRVGGSNPQNLTDNPANDTQPAFSPNGQYIAFRSERDGGGIFLMGASGESARRLSERGLAYHPAWSPDSSEVIYTEEPVENPRERSVKPSHLWAVNVNTLQRRLIAEVDAAQPSWSPNGLRIAYCALAKNGQRNIWTMTVKGDQIRAITDGPMTDWNPIWASDGQALYFVSDRSGSMQLWRVAVDEASGQTLGDPELVPTPAAYSQHPTLASDGKRLAFVQLTPLYALHRYAFDAERGRLVGEPKPLLQNAKAMFNPDVSPEGQRLVYYASDGGQEDLFWLNSDGSNQPQQLTDDPANDRAPRWSPDGNRLAFYSNRTGNWELWTLNADGSGLRQVTFASSPDQAAFFPTWSADSSKLLFMLRRLQPSFSVGPYFIRANGTAATPPEPVFTQATQYPTFWARAWSPDRNLLAGAARDQADTPALITYDLRTQQVRRVLETPDEVPQWLNDNRRLLVYRGRRLMLIDTQTQREQEVFSALPYRYNGYALSPDNRFLYLVMNLSEANICLLSLK
jgi:eukaryotic-like serine/threonine-protein kinase